MQDKTYTKGKLKQKDKMITTCIIRTSVCYPVWSYLSSWSSSPDLV